MYQSISNEDKKTQYSILLHRAHRRAIALQYPARDLDMFSKDFQDRSIAARFLSAEDLEIYDACREAAVRKH